MFYPRTERQERWITIANELAERFDARAAANDRAGAFPFENFIDIRAAGLPALVVPIELGGWGADLSETVMTVEALAAGDGSTALGLAMHMQTIGAAAEERNWPHDLFERLCREIVTRSALVNAVASEPELGSPSRGGKPRTTARPILGAGGHPFFWVIDGRKSYASLIPVLDYLIVPAALEDGSDEVGRFLVPSSSGIEIVETWDALGMRGTGSHDVVLTEVTVPHDYLISRTDSTKPTGDGKANAWFSLTVSAVYTGIASAALRSAARYARVRTPTALGRPIADLESIQRQLGLAGLTLHAARQLLYHSAELWELHPDARRQLGPTVAVAKVTATNAAVAAVDHCMRAVGGAAMTRALPLERYYRDVRAGLNHPINDDAALIQLGRLALRADEELAAS